MGSRRVVSVDFTENSKADARRGRDEEVRQDYVFSGCAIIWQGSEKNPKLGPLALGSSQAIVLTIAVSVQLPHTLR